ncbi:beta-carotene isomerase D27, chloroplastic isoform X2 [Solanum tuberosum]|uniref:beta-carotene isomerase D27, chloroplastic isoform X2 n=1 Tax=Solanum tuberosum TaxID=4113 RepID=UPI00073A0B65|nr:PREDICTED: beta-carotene isomerase D27, chloroplastic isoform X2 [Solanum tuberosum]
MAMVPLPSSLFAWPKVYHGKTAIRVSCFSNSTSEPIEARKPKVFDNLFLSLFRNKMVQETGWDSEKPGYQGLIEVAHRLTVGQDNSKTRDAALYRMLVAPIHSGKFAALMVARVTALSCQWLMGPCAVNSVDLPNGSSLMSGVFVEKCKYLEESKCVGVCINTCKLPTQTFFKDHMGVPLLMEPNFTDYSCQFKFGILPPQQEVDDALKEPCLEICPSSVRRKEMNHNIPAHKCPKA